MCASKNATRSHFRPPWQHDYMSSLRLNYESSIKLRVLWSKITLKEPLDFHMWIHGYISWNWQEFNSIKATRRVFPRITRPYFAIAYHLGNHAVESKYIAYLEISLWHSSCSSNSLSSPLVMPWCSSSPLKTISNTSSVSKFASRGLLAAAAILPNAITGWSANTKNSSCKLIWRILPKFAQDLGKSLYFLCTKFGENRK